MSKTKIFIILLFVLIIFILYYLGLFDLKENYYLIKDYIHGTGYFGYFIFIIIFSLATLFSIHGSILAIIAGVLYGPWIGGILSVIGGTIGAALSFIVARYLFKDEIEKRFADNSFYKKINEGIEKNGTNYLIVTRLVIIFPFNIQNYVYGLTNISFIKYTIITFLAIIPGTFIYTFFAGELVANNFALTTESFIKFLIASILLTVLVIAPKKYFERKGVLKVD